MLNEVTAIILFAAFPLWATTVAHKGHAANKKISANTLICLI